MRLETNPIFHDASHQHIFRFHKPWPNVKYMPQNSKSWFSFWGVWNTSAGQLAERQLPMKRGRCIQSAANLQQPDFSSEGTTASLRLRMDFSTISIFTELLTFLANMSMSPDRTVITLKQYVRGKNGWDFLLLHFSNLNREEGAGMHFHLLSSN